jgi:AraC-like DNA-binding protein
MGGRSALSKSPRKSEGAKLPPAASRCNVWSEYAADINVASVDRRVRFALNFIDKHYPANTTLIENIAPQINISLSRFRHLFKEETGLTPSQYLRLLRLEKAKTLLEESFLTIKEVVNAVGLTDVSHFVRSYKLRYRKTPSQSRKDSTAVPKPRKYLPAA